MMSRTVDRMQDAAAALWRFLTVPARAECPGMAAWPRLDALDGGAGAQDEPHDRPTRPDYGPPTTRLDVLAACRAADYFEDWRHLGPDVREQFRDAVRDWLPQIDALDPLRHPLPGAGLGDRSGDATADGPENPGAAPETAPASAETTSAIAPEATPTARAWRTDDAARLASLIHHHGTANADEWPRMAAEAPNEAPAPKPLDDYQAATTAQRGLIATHPSAYCPRCDAWHDLDACPQCGKAPVDPFPVTVNTHPAPEARPNATNAARLAVQRLADRWHERQAIAGNDLITALQHIAAALPHDAGAAPDPRRDTRGRFTRPD